MNISNLLRKILIFSIYVSNKFFGEKSKGFSIICYHDFSKSRNKYSISPRVFKKQVLTLQKNDFKFVGVNELERVFSGKEVTGKNVLLTIDDGYESVNKVIPFLIKNKIPALLFILSDRKLANRKELDNDFKLLTTKEIKKITKKGIVIGCHSATHANFQNLTTDEIEREVIFAKKNLEKKLGFEVRYFAYPKGIYNSNVIKAVRKAGFKGAFAVRGGNIDFQTERFAIPRVVVDKNTKTSDLPIIISRYWFNLRNLLDKFSLYERIAKI